MEIVRIAPEDALRLRSLRLRALQDAPDAFGATLDRALQRSLEDWAQGIRELATFVAVVGRTDVGLVRGVEDRDDATSAWLISMWVAPTHRGTGIGRALIGALVEWAQAEGYSRVRLDVADSNTPAIRLYVRTGFEPTGEVSSLPPPRTHITEHTRVRELRAS